MKKKSIKSNSQKQYSLIVDGSDCGYVWLTNSEKQLQGFQGSKRVISDTYGKAISVARLVKVNF